MTYKTVVFPKFLSRDCLEQCIMETYAATLKDPSDPLTCELRTLLFHYLKKHSLTRELVPVCKKIIGTADLETLFNIHEYNYEKLKLIL